MLGYALLRQGDNAGAINAFQEYVRMLPQEPNPQDSLGEALMAAGRLDEANTAFNKAVELAPDFWNAYEGLAFARIYSGDWVGGRKAFELAKMNAPTAVNKLTVSNEIAAAVAAQGRTSEALQILDATRQTPGVEAGVLALVPVRRAHVLIVGGQQKQAIAAVAPALATADDPTTPPALARPLRTDALRARITAEGQLNDTTAVAATAALLQKDATDRPDDPAARTAGMYADGIVAMIKRDFASAQKSFEACAAEDDWCQWQAIAAAGRADDKTAAAKGRERMLRLYRRDPVYLMVRSQVERPARPSTD
jgi:tetratricopeptide (TPR) repeat protein